MCIPQSNITQKRSSSVTSTHERPTSCPAPRQRTRIGGEDEEVIFFFFFARGWKRSKKRSRKSEQAAAGDVDLVDDDLLRPSFFLLCSLAPFLEVSRFGYLGSLSCRVDALMAKTKRPERKKKEREKASLMV